VHRDAWEPSRVTEASYARVQEAWPYRKTLDCVVEAPDGRFAASAILWPDDANGVGELEPVGVRPEFRRLGLGAAVCTFALQRWFEEGGRRAIVYCESEPACALYASIGFEQSLVRSLIVDLHQPRIERWEQRNKGGHRLWILAVVLAENRAWPLAEELRKRVEAQPRDGVAFG